MEKPGPVKNCLPTIFNLTAKEINGSNKGIGPIQLKNVKIYVSNIKNRIIAFAGNMQQQTTVAAQSSITDEIQKMDELYRQGIISEEEFNSFKKQLLNKS